MVVARVGQRLMNQQILVQRRRDLSDEDGVARGGEWLAFVGQQGVHRMPRFMRQGGNVIPLAIEVEQLIGMHAIHPRRVRARAFARAGQKIGPSGLQAMGQLLVVLRPQGRHSGQGHAHRILH